MVAAVLAGTAIVQVATQYKLDKGLVSRWVATDAPTQRACDPAEELGGLILGLIRGHLTAIHAQLQAAARPEWLEKQTAAELAQLVAVERDTTIRLLAGLRPATPELPEPAVDAAPASDSADGD